MSELYLVAHKVRGEAAFDVACMLDVLDEDGDPIWIIPTSGHRARPYWQCPIADLICEDTSIDARDWPYITSVVPIMPPDLLDHYHLDAPRPSTKLIDRLNLHRPAAPPITRRF